MKKLKGIGIEDVLTYKSNNYSKIKSIIHSKKATKSLIQNRKPAIQTEVDFDLLSLYTPIVTKLIRPTNQHVQP